jgi:hypothetical protein
MRSADVIQLYDMVGVGAKVDITQETIAQATGVPETAPQTAQPAIAAALLAPKAVEVLQQPFSTLRP